MHWVRKKENKEKQPSQSHFKDNLAAATVSPQPSRKESVSLWALKERGKNPAGTAQPQHTPILR